MSVAYILRRFPKFSETFILQEISELIRQGEAVWIASLYPPHPGEPRHPGAEALAADACYLPIGVDQFPALLVAGLTSLAAEPARAWPALAWSLRWAIGEGRWSHLQHFAQACYLHQRLPAEVTHIHSHYAHGPASVALLLARLSGRPFSFTGHARDIFELTPPDLLAAKVAEAAFVVAVSAYTRDYFRSVLGAAGAGNEAKVAVVRNGIDGSRFTQRSGQPDGSPCLLSVARLVEKKGLDTLVEACRLLARGGVQLRCEILGEGPERAPLEGQIREAGLEGMVHLRGMGDQGEVLAAYRAATVFALPCRRMASGDQDGLPVSILEAMWVGVPVVSTPIAGIPEVVTDGETGVLVPPDDAEALATALGRLLADPEMRARLAAAARRQAEAAFDLGGCVGRLRGLFAAAAGLPGGA